MASVSSKDLIKDLLAAGWKRVRQRGSHVQFKHDERPGIITVPHPQRDMPLGTAASI